MSTLDPILPNLTPDLPLAMIRQQLQAEAAIVAVVAEASQQLARNVNAGLDGTAPPPSTDAPRGTYLDINS